MVDVQVRAPGAQSTARAAWSMQCACEAGCRQVHTVVQKRKVRHQPMHDRAADLD